MASVCIGAIAEPRLARNCPQPSAPACQLAQQAEIEIVVLRGQCLDRRIDDATRLISEIGAWKQQRNAAGALIKRMFTTEKARAKNGPRALARFLRGSEAGNFSMNDPQLVGGRPRRQGLDIVLIAF